MPTIRLSMKSLITKFIHLFTRFSITGHSHGGHGHSHGGGGHGHSHGGHESHSHDGHEVEHSGDAHSHEPYELTNLKVAQTNNGVLSNHVIDSDDEGDKIDDQLNGIAIDEDSRQIKTKMGKSLPSRVRTHPGNPENTGILCHSHSRPWIYWNFAKGTGKYRNMSLLFS